MFNNFSVIIVSFVETVIENCIRYMHPEVPRCHLDVMLLLLERYRGGGSKPTPIPKFSLAVWGLSSTSGRLNPRNPSANRTLLVCLHCTSPYPKTENRISKPYNLCTCYPWMWLCHSLTTMQYIVYFYISGFVDDVV